MVTKNLRFASLIGALALTTLTSVATAHQTRLDPALQRPKVLTPTSKVNIALNLEKAYFAEFGRSINDKALACAWAQVALENASGKEMWNHNFGNVGPSWQGGVPWYRHSRLTVYRSYDTFFEGAQGYWHVVGWCKTAMRSFDHGEPAQAAADLRRCGYYGAPLSLYANAMTRLYYYATHKILPEEKYAKEQQLAQQAWVEYQQQHPFSPACACSG